MKFNLNIIWFLSYAFFVIGCSSSSSHRDHLSLLKAEKLYFSEPASHATQVFKGELYLLVGLKSIYKLNHSDELELIYSLADERILKNVKETVLASDTTYPFMKERMEPLTNYNVDEFFINDESLFLSVRVLFPYLSEYNGQPAQANLFQRIILRLSTESYELLNIHSVMVSLDEFNKDSTDHAGMEQGFMISNNERGVVKNLTFTHAKQRIPELLHLKELQNFKWKLDPLIYFEEKPGIELTSTRGYFHGELRKTYCGYSGCYEFSENKIDTLLFNPISADSGGVYVMGLSDFWTAEDKIFRYRNLWTKASDQLVLEVVQNEDSIVYSKDLGDIQLLKGFEFINQSAHFLWADTLSNGFYMQRFVFQPS